MILNVRMQIAVLLCGFRLLFFGASKNCSREGGRLIDHETLNLNPLFANAMAACFVVTHDVFAGKSWQTIYSFRAAFLVQIRGQFAALPEPINLQALCLS